MAELCKNGVVYNSSINVDEYIVLRKAVGWQEITKEQAQESLNNSIFIVSAKYNGETIGMARIIGDGAFYHLLVDVIVIDEFQSKGIGTEMVEKSIEFLKGKLKQGQYSSLQLTAAKGRESFYEKFGFVQRPNDQVGSGMGIILNFG